MNDLIVKILTANGIDSTLPAGKYASGQINAVFHVGNEFVVKVEKNLDVTAHQPELMRLARLAGAKVPEPIGAGTIDGVSYLIMRQIPGRRVAEDWHLFDARQKESMMRQLAAQLTVLHGITFETYAIPRPRSFATWKEALRSYTDWSDLDPAGMDAVTRTNFERVTNHYLAHEAALEISGPPVLVHNDVHFENILHEDGILTGLLDFDFARQAPRDYELWHIIDFFQNPKYYVDESLESVWGSFVLADELRVLCACEPELFQDSELLARQRLYLTENLISTLRDGAIDKFNEKVDAYFNTDWLEKTLDSATASA